MKYEGRENPGNIEGDIGNVAGTKAMTFFVAVPNLSF